MRRLGSRKHIHTFSREDAPSYTVGLGERVVVETADAFSGKVRGEKVLFEDLDMADVNPATGPIEVKGISAGDILAVTIERIKCGPRGVMMCSPELGNLSSEVRRSRTKMVRVGKDRAWLSKDLEIELRPHVGVIGVCPALGSIPTFHPGNHGGNMDTAEVGPGSILYLRAEVDGAMVSMGDVHAAMGDVEVCGTGIEVPAEFTVSFS
jgi:amidase